MSERDALMATIICRRQQLAAQAAHLARAACERGADRVAALYQRDAADHAERARALYDLATWIPEQVAA